MINQVKCRFIWNEWKRQWDMERQVDNSLIDNYNHCRGAMMIFGLREEDKDKIVYGSQSFFERSHVVQREPIQRSNPMSVFTESKGWTTHFHALGSILCCVVALYAVIIGDAKVAGIFAILALGNNAAAIGCLRQKVETLSK